MPRIAIPQPRSDDAAYNARNLAHYRAAVEAFGGEAVELPLGASNGEIARLASTCQAVLLPGSSADVDPQKYSAERDPHTAAADIERDNVDELLLQDAYNLRKPVFGICYGVQSLNVWRTGTLKQHIISKVDHEAGSKVPVAHEVTLEPRSRLAKTLALLQIETTLPVNSSHHQSVELVGDGLRAVAHCPQDGIIEAVEGNSAEHWVLGVQWHPERGFDRDLASQALFRDFVEAAKRFHPKPPAGG